MTQSEAHSISSITPGSRVRDGVAVGERKLRRVSAWLLLFFLLQGELGAVWDREWHAFVGRDQFWTPPHTLIYSCVAGAGLLALAIVLFETVRYRRHVPGVDDSSTMPIFGFFHAPLGFCVLGFGALLALISAPLDNYWHELYGIDIALWAPFHLMGITGGLIGILGMVYVFASEAAIERSEKKPVRRYFGLSTLELGIILTLASFMNFVLTGFLQFPIITIGTLHITTYPLPLVIGGAFCFVAVMRIVQKPGAATFLTLLLVLHTLVVELFVPWAIRASVGQNTALYRIPGKIPSFGWDYALLPFMYIVSSILIDLVAYRMLKRGGTTNNTLPWTAVLGIIITPSTLLLAPLLLRTYTGFAPVFLPEPGIAIPAPQFIVIVTLSISVALIAGAVGALLGADFGDIWRWNRR
ncbi:MAG: hypothetical protein H0U76_20165 [Ktedonobacteraceae bacterium]|nr:hypothetical protein [Ktedonobacteraceae bacterium]